TAFIPASRIDSASRRSAVDANAEKFLTMWGMDRIRESTDRNVSPRDAAFGIDDLPQLVATRAERRRAGQQVEIPHALEAFIVCVRDLRPALLHVRVP